MPVPQMSPADLVMAVELQQAKAELEDCYRRRARRVGLEDTLLESRPMTEQEIEDLQWRLGDFGPTDGRGSRGRKRSQQDVINMTIEEMEAELQETNEAIRKRRRRTPGLTLKPLWVLMALAYLAGGPVEAFTAYDCTNRSKVVEAYSLLEPDACAKLGRDGEVETTIFGEIVQIKQDRMIPVFRCIVIETLVAQYCGMFSAAGVTRYLKFRELMPLEAWECRKARRTGLHAHQWEARGGEDRDHRVPHHVPVREPRRQQQLRGGHGNPPKQESARRDGIPGIVRGYPQRGVREDERVDRQLDADLWSASKGSGQEHLGQPGGDRGVGVRPHGVPVNHRQAVQGDDEGLCEPEQHV
jgi:hypothetical protein